MIKKTTNNFLLHEYPTRKLQHHHFEKGEIFYFTREKKLNKPNQIIKLDLFLNKSTLMLTLIICFEILIFYYAILQLLEKNTLGLLRHLPRCWRSRLAIWIAYSYHELSIILQKAKLYTLHKDTLVFGIFIKLINLLSFLPPRDIL